MIQNRFFFLLLLAILPSVCVGQFSPDTVEYLWPTNASRYLSGTFGETRSQHFHAALDIKTWGRRGYDVYATRDGTLHRLAIGPGGYGKAIYLKHEDGSYSVYAHLLSFEEKIQQLADSIRFVNYNNDLDVVLDSLNIRVKRGQKIAYSGATGIGPPHLHFELRTPSEKPFNPLLTNLAVEDDLPPRFSGLAVEPLSSRSTVEGSSHIVTKRAVRNNGAYDFGRISVRGPVGLAVDIYDRANRVHNSYAVYDLKLRRDSLLLFHSRVDSFSYEETGQMFLDRIYPLLKQTGNAYQRLHVPDGNTLPFYQTGNGGGRLNLPPGHHELKIVAEDYNGNRSTATLSLDVKPPVTMQASPLAYESNGRHGSNGSNGSNGDYGEPPIADQWDWRENWIAMNGPASRRFSVIALDEGRHYAELQTLAADAILALHTSELQTIFPAGHVGDDRRWQLFRLLPGREKRIYNSGSGLTAYATFFANSVYDTLAVGLRATHHSPDSVKFEIRPDNQPLKNSFELTYVLEADQQEDTTLAFYAYDKRRDRLSYIPTRRGGPVLKGSADQLANYYLLPDSTAPEIHSPRVLRRADGTWMGMVRADDNRSGIDHRTAEFYINGVRGIAEYEPEDDRILYYHPDFGPAAEYHFRIVVSDMVGNSTDREFQLR
ncbi:MAG: M23 family metallopeptidase [Balneolaceae bacterium]|nr:M23 family metallopeptidase [Balneolaceae bacterium]